MTNFAFSHLTPIRKNKQQIYCLKTIESANTGDPAPPAHHHLPRGPHKCMVP